MQSITTQLTALHLGAPSTADLRTATVAGAELRKSDVVPAVDEDLADFILRLAARCDMGGRAAAADRSIHETPRLDRWSVLRPLSSGGFGNVYLARDARGRRAALKVLRGDRTEDDACVESFATEAAALELLRHRGVPALLDSGTTEDGLPYVAMRFVVGRTLSAVAAEWRKHRSSRRTRLLRLAEGVVAAGRIVAEAHDLGVLHLDLKPDNILMSGTGRTTVIDWGLARLPQAATRRGDDTSTFGAGCNDATAPRCAGTPAYLSPERLRTATWQPSVVDDVYSLGVTLWRVVAGRLPLGAASGNIERTVAGLEVDDHTSLTAGRLLAVAARAMSPARADRPQSAAAFSDAVEQALGTSG